MDRTWTRLAPQSPRPAPNSRGAQRRRVVLPARLAWKDRRGVNRFASVVTRDVSETGVFVECHSPVSIPLYRLVQFQLERDAWDGTHLPWSVRQGRVLSAVYRISSAQPGDRQGIALRLMVDPKRVPVDAELSRATA